MKGNKMQRYFSALLEQATERTKESTLGVLGIANHELRQHLSQQMSQLPGEEFAFLAPPVFEHTFAWEYANQRMRDLSGELLHQDVVNALDDLKNGRRYRFGAEFHPFKHQLTSWKKLLKEKKSIVVTSGTGSGKTECFMIPILNDLYEQSLTKKEALEGVHALFLYPLNALINSQQERLDAWTQHFGNKIRYCLYNGNTEERDSKVRKKQKPNQVLSRELMRKHPAPILVTNGTMLEYMLIRQMDAPILEKSKQNKTLRWIVLDEAHSYMGSQAAELALQLRRVLQGFGVEAQDIRFVATSATIADENAEQQLKLFLSQLAGIPTENIEVIGGQRRVPILPLTQKTSQLSLDDLCQIDPTYSVSPARFDALTQHDIACALRDGIVQSTKPKTSLELQRILASKGIKLTQMQILEWLDLLTNTQANEKDQAFLKLRGHFMQRITQGLWGCISPDCEHKKDTELKNWPYGLVYANQRQHCDCGAPVLELAFCKECNEPHLLGAVIDVDGEDRLTQTVDGYLDEFSLLQDQEEDDDAPKQASKRDISEEINNHKLLLSHHETSHRPYNFDKEGNETYKEDSIVTLYACASSCAAPDCGFTTTKPGQSPVERSILGAPFYVTQAIPSVLEFCPQISEEDLQESQKEKNHNLSAQNLPAQGRKLITFTDSRQGTARMSVQLQQDAQRARLRGAVVDILKQEFKNSSNENEQLIKLQKRLDKYKTMHDADMQDEISELEEKISFLSTSLGQTQALSWQEMVQRLNQVSDIQNWIANAIRYYSPKVFKDLEGLFKVAHLLLLSEYSRRPKKRNSTETLGLVKIGYTGLDQVRSTPNESWDAKNLNLQDWHDFLKVCLDFYIREYYYIYIEHDISKWMGRKIATKRLLSSSSAAKNDRRTKKWPNATANSKNRLVKLLALGADLDLNKPGDLDIINGWLECAWKALTQQSQILSSDVNQFFLRPEKMTFSLVKEAFICPKTQRLIDTTFKGLTPYLPLKLPKDKAAWQCEKIAMPDITQFFSDADIAQRLTELRRLIKQNPQVQKLRQNNLWNDLTDRIVEGGYYYQVAEHSAQQSSSRLEKYEDLFKTGRLNVMNCSTTMEMGVDIGGISAVVMNNVPPHPANYLQRAGRAGRSKEARALSYTICKSNPHDQYVFKQPKWAFETVIPAPHVTFNSKRLVQRHVNSLLFSLFLRDLGQTDTEKTRLTLQWFYTKPEDQASLSVCDTFLAWLADHQVFEKALKTLTNGTALATESVENLTTECARLLKLLQQRWLTEFNKLNSEISATKSESPYRVRLNFEYKRLCEEYLLKELAAKCFLPGYGFPTDIVTFETNNYIDQRRKLEEKGKDESQKNLEDNVSLLREMPTRNLAVAIREYAPGAEVVLDGLVFKSSGISLAWHNIHSNDSREAQKFNLAWKCPHCHQTGYSSESAVDCTELYCDNTDCGKKIPPKYTRQILQPAGFVHDYYVEPTNDVSSQQFIPVQEPWVVAKGEKRYLPNNVLGYMVADETGHVLHYSSGLHGHGYAICMTCGRAESQTHAHEFPKHFSPEVPHEPLKAVQSDKWDQDGKRLDCEGSLLVIKDLHLGSYVTTDVFELVLQHPETHEYLLVNEKNTKIALTLAVAVRKALAKQLGISSSELGFGIRNILLEDQTQILAIQLFDLVSGGAGFSTEAPHYIQTILYEMFEELKCDAKCESSCGQCLLDTQTRHYFHKLDRKLASNWLGTTYQHYIAPVKAEFFPEGQYSPLNLTQCIERYLGQGAKRLSLVLNENIDQWDIFHPEVKRKLIYWQQKENLTVEIVLTQPLNCYQDFISELALYKNSLNLHFSQAEDASPHIVAQVELENKCVTIACEDLQASCPNQNWLKTQSITLFNENQKVLVKQDITEQIQLPLQQPIVELELSSQLNGDLFHFGHRYWKELITCDKRLHDIFTHDKVTEVIYIDRYLQSPSNILLLSSWLYGLQKILPFDIKNITICTLFKKNEKEQKFLHHDFTDITTYRLILKSLLKNKLGQDCQIGITENKDDIPHRRLIKFTLESGKRLMIQLDQGLGYWRIYEIQSDGRINRYIKFDPFNLSDEQVIENLESLEKALKLKNGETFATNAYIKLLNETVN